VYASAMIVLSIVFASFVSISGLNDTISARTANNEAGRYLFPMLLAWAFTMIILFFGDSTSSTSDPDDKAVSANPASGLEAGLETLKL
jgi:branched-subunit amino acid permease